MYGFHEALVIFYIADMMILGFSFLYMIFSRERISKRLIYIVISILLYMGVISVVVFSTVFWGFNAILGIILLIISSTLFALPLKSSSDVISWRDNSRYTVPVVLTLVLYELAMGYVYGSVFLPHNVNAFLLAVNNIDFSLMMVADGIFFLLLSRKVKDISELALFTFAVSMALMPNFFVHFHDISILASVLSSSALMVANIVLLYIIQIRIKTFNRQVLVLGLSGADLLMMVGLSFFAMNKGLMLMAISMVVSMLVYFFLVTHKINARKITLNRSYAFALLLLINGAELAMSLGVTSLGMKLSVSIFSGSTVNYASYLTTLSPGMIHSIDFSNPLWWLFPFDPAKMGMMAFKAGSSVNAPFAYFWSSFMLIMSTTMSPFYAIMMGSEMSYLVLERYRRTRDKRVRNWALAIIAGIPLFVILIPFYTPFYVFGMSGMLFAVPLLLLLISIGAIVIVSILFGRRAQCNLVCMSAHMWTNIYYDQFKPSKHHSWWEAMRWFSFVAMIVSFSVFTLQQVGFMKPLMVGKVMINPLDFYGMFVLNYVWWFFYFLTPVFGTYSCARQGWCGFGTLSGIFNKVFFRIKAKDLAICETCETRSCESSCPISIQLHIDFTNKGYSNRVSCVGCGDCVESCSYSNLTLLDVRDYIRGKRQSQ